MPKQKQFETTLYIRIPIGTFAKIERLRKKEKVSRSMFVRGLVYRQFATIVEK